MRYVALLRGINVGGNNMISMLQLRVLFEKAGMTDVSTYINSGNILLSSKLLSSTKIAEIIERSIYDNLGIKVNVLIRNVDDFLAIARALPDNWTNDKAMKCDVMFLWNQVDNHEIMKQLVIKPEIDHILYIPGALLWSVNRKDITNSGMLKLIGTDLYKQMTIRNCNTVRKLATLSENSHI